jgi:hypothetical protein
MNVGVEDSFKDCTCNTHSTHRGHARRHRRRGDEDKEPYMKGIELIQNNNCKNVIHSNNIRYSGTKLQLHLVVLHYQTDHCLTKTQILKNLFKSDGS